MRGSGTSSSPPTQWGDTAAAAEHLVVAFEHEYAAWRGGGIRAAHQIRFRVVDREAVAGRANSGITARMIAAIAASSAGAMGRMRAFAACIRRGAVLQAAGSSNSSANSQAGREQEAWPTGRPGAAGTRVAPRSRCLRRPRRTEAAGDTGNRLADRDVGGCWPARRTRTAGWKAGPWIGGAGSCVRCSLRRNRRWSAPRRARSRSAKVRKVSGASSISTRSVNSSSAPRPTDVRSMSRTVAAGPRRGNWR